MKKHFSLMSLCIVFALGFLMLTGLQAFAQEVVIPVVANEDFLKLLIESIGGAKGATTLAIVGIAVKLILAFLSTEFCGQIFKKLTGGVKLVIVLALSLVAGFVSLKMTGVSTSAALLHSSTLSAFMVLSNQVYKQFFDKKAVVQV